MNPASRMAMIMGGIGLSRVSHQMQHSLAHCGSQGIAPHPHADERVVELSVRHEDFEREESPLFSGIVGRQVTKHQELLSNQTCTYISTVWRRASALNQFP